MTLPQLSESTEMYLKAMAEMSGPESVAIGRLAERLSVTHVSANEMIKKLGEQGLVSHTPYKGVNLTQKGKEAACNVLRRQRLWEVFLYEHLKIEWARVYELACALEHATAPEVTEALAGFLGNPKTCPRGNPIPDEYGTFIPLNGIVLSGVGVGRSVKVLAVTATATDVRRYLQERNILPGHELEVLEAAPLKGPLSEEDVRRGINAGTHKSPHLKLAKLTKETRTAFELTGFDMFIETYDDEQAAIASLK